MVAGTVVVAVGTPLVIGLAGVALGVAVAGSAIALNVYGGYQIARRLHHHAVVREKN